MSKKQATKRKVPMRKCVVSGQMFPKKDLVRIVRNKEGEIALDPSGRLNGRGAYIGLDLEIAKQAKQERAFNRVFQTEVEGSFYDEVIDYIDHKLARMELEEQLKNG